MYVNKTKAIINVIFYKWPDYLFGEVTHPSDNPLNESIIIVATLL